MLVSDLLKYIEENNIPHTYRVGVRVDEGRVDIYADSLDSWGAGLDGCLEITDEVR